jgi:hypothetical protein
MARGQGNGGDSDGFRKCVRFAMVIANFLILVSLKNNTQIMSIHFYHLPFTFF